MPEKTANENSRSILWRIAGLWMVVLALGLAMIGVYLAIDQSRRFTQRLMSIAETDAGRLAEDTQERLDRALTEALRDVLSFAGEDASTPFGGIADQPVWIDGVFVVEGDAVRVLTPASHDVNEWVAAASTVAEEARNQLEPSRPRTLATTIGETDGLLAWMGSTDHRGNLIVGAIGINLPRLRSVLVEPLMALSTGLELVSATADDRPWSQPFYGPLRPFWSIKPSEAFVRELRSAVLRQTLAFLGPTVLALITLLVAMWALARIVRREVALAAMKANFVADVSHELKTPLALIRMFGETLQSGRVMSDEKRNEYYGIIARESARLTDLIENILDFSRIEAGRKDYVLEPIDVGAVVRETYEAYAAHLEHNGFEHHLAVEASLPNVNADSGAITQAVINLINNAIKYSREERSLAIDVTTDTRRNRRGVLISMHDRGIGIRPEDRARLFEGFFRSADGRVRERGGTGLGLALVKHIVDGHGGSLDVESRLVSGSTFRIFLPAVLEDPTTSTA